MPPLSVGCCSRKTGAAVVTFSAADPEPTPISGPPTSIAHLPRVALDPAEVERVVVLAAHPDDESLGAGGLLSQAARTGCG